MMEPPPVPSDDIMIMDDIVESSQEATQSTQQSTQQDSQQQNGGNPMDSHLWGFLQPCNPALKRIDFWKIQPTYQFGRNPNAGNDMTFSGLKISNIHCTISWDGLENYTSTVVVHDKSSNGTFINGVKVGKDRVGILREGNELAFGTSQPQTQEYGMEDYRFLFRLTAGGPPLKGFYKYYDVGLQLGKGTFASVHKAIRKDNGEWFAVKIIDLNKVKAPIEVDEYGRPRSKTTAFAREITILEKLKHRNICQLKEAFFQEDYKTLNLVLELVEGGDLLDYILTRNGLKEPSAQHISYQMCDALAYIHSQGIAHRDLKPENVLLTRDNPPIVKVADFGLAKAVDNITMLRTMCGTPSYLAPEVVTQSANREGYDQVVDSWSVGVIIFSMLTNTSPFIEDDSLEMMSRIVQRRVDWPTLESAEVSGLAVNFVRRLLATQPHERMTLAHARFDPWLQNYTEFMGIQPPDYPPTKHEPTTDDSIYESFTSNGSLVNHGYLRRTSDPIQDMDGLKLEPDPSHISIPGAYPVDNGVQPEPSRLLRRRSHVIGSAAEAGEELPEPSQEMISNATGIRSGDTRKNKRKAPLSRLSEDDESYEVVESTRGNAPLTDANNRKKVRGPQDMETVTPARVAKARGKAKASPATPAKVKGGGRMTRAAAANMKEEQLDEEDSEAEEERPRRTGRQMQKTPRRF